MRIWRSRHAPTSNDASTIMDLEKEVKTHTRRVEWGRTGTLCPSVSPVWRGEEGVLPVARLPAAEVPAGPGAVHPGNSVLDLTMAVPACGKRFTDYPPFALPGKRFIKSPVLEKAGEYLGTDHSYAKTVQAPGDAHHVRRPHSGRFGEGVWSGPQHGVAVVVVAGRNAGAPCGLPGS